MIKFSDTKKFLLLQIVPSQLQHSCIIAMGQVSHRWNQNRLNMCWNQKSQCVDVIIKHMCWNKNYNRVTEIRIKGSKRNLESKLPLCFSIIMKKFIGIESLMGCEIDCTTFTSHGFSYCQVITWTSSNYFLPTGQLSDLLPFTNYSISFVACTTAGCTEASDRVYVTTLEEGMYANVA